MFRAGVVLRRENIPLSQRQRGTLFSHAEITRPKNKPRGPAVELPEHHRTVQDTQWWLSPRARTEGTIFRERISKRYCRKSALS